MTFRTSFDGTWPSADSAYYPGSLHSRSLPRNSPTNTGSLGANNLCNGKRIVVNKIDMDSMDISYMKFNLTEQTF